MPDMETHKITVAFVNEPDGNPKKGNIKDTDGNYWGVWKEDLAHFERGGQYEITVKANDWRGTRKWDVVGKSVKKIAGPAESNVVAINGRPQARPSYTSRMSPAEQRTIFGSAVLKSLIEAKVVDLGNFDEACYVITRGYDRHFGEGGGEEGVEGP